MGIFSSIASKVFSFATGSANAAETTKEATPAPTTTETSAASTEATSTPQVDVAAVLKELADKAGQSFNYQTSIVDLLKLLGLDSSLSARQKLADELHFNGDKNDTASMNVWLIKQVYTELAKNGGKIPENWGH